MVQISYRAHPPHHGVLKGNRVPLRLFGHGDFILIIIHKLGGIIVIVDEGNYRQSVDTMLDLFDIHHSRRPADNALQLAQYPVKLGISWTRSLHRVY
mmetsp:Transcript_26010/g.39310  ORF Transcript_26010/g.39310 Transcript_26010/m.39310 type:complete len:97 (+) Transcript_26010:855-1145(+)